MNKKMNSMHKVSIIAPVYNMEKYIHQFLDSVIKQTYKNIEIILVDDGSKDGSGEILDDYAQKDERIKVIHKQNAGVSMARNDGISIATGDYFYIVDSDDWLEKNAVELLMKRVVETGADVIIADNFISFESGRETIAKKFDNEFTSHDKEMIVTLQKTVLFSGYAPYHKASQEFEISAMWDKLVKKSVITNNNLKFDPGMHGIFDDGVFNIAVLEHASSVSYINKPVYHFRQVSSSISHRFYKDRLERNRLEFEGIKKQISCSVNQEKLKEAYYARVLSYMIAMFTHYYTHEDNEESFLQKKQGFKEMINSHPYKEALRRVNKDILGLKEKVFVYLLKKRWFALTEIAVIVNKKIQKKCSGRVV